jgi:hypothetical protein
MYNLSLKDNDITFNNLEKKIYKYVCNKACEFMKEVLTHLDRRLMDERDSKIYRNTSSNIKELTNQEISHTAVWNVVQKLGSKIEEKEERKILLNKRGQLNGSKEVNVLFQEMDGIWLSIQGKDKPKRGRSKKRELKLGVTYEGWKKRDGSKDAYVVENKLAYASFGSSKEFKELSDDTIAEIYNIDEIKVRILNGDGASWIKQSIEEEDVHFQLDLFHKSQAVLRAIHDKKEAHKLIRMLNKGKVGESFKYLTKLMVKYTKNILKMRIYIRNLKSYTSIFLIIKWDLSLITCEKK